MNKTMITFTLSSMLSMSLFLYGCRSAASSEPAEKSTSEMIQSELIQFELKKENTDETASVDPPAEDAPTETSADTTVSQGGPYGKISLSIPDGWRYETCPMDSGETDYGLYGIRFYPEDVTDGYISLNYADSFGVCGMGLATEKATIAREPANIGTYDNNIYWDFIAFKDDYDGIVALTYSVDEWWETYSEQVMDILNTLSFDSAAKEGGAYINNNKYDLDQIGLSFTLKNISPAGATLVFYNYDADAPTGELEYGDDFWLEIQKDNVWEEVPVTLEGNYGFHAIAYVIPAKGCSEQELNWEWLYGTLAPGTYRIRKSIHDFRGSGDYDEYTAYAQFILN